MSEAAAFSLTKTLSFVLITTLTSSFLLACVVSSNPLSNVEEVDKTQVDGKKSTAPDTQFLVQSGIDGGRMAKRDAIFCDYNTVTLEEEKRSRNVPSRNPYSWMTKNEEKRAKNPYSWLASEPAESSGGAWRKLPSPPKRQRGMVVAAPSSWTDDSAKRATGVRNPYSWMNYI